MTTSHAEEKNPLKRGCYLGINYFHDPKLIAHSQHCPKVNLRRAAAEDFHNLTMCTEEKVFLCFIIDYQ